MAALQVQLCWPSRSLYFAAIVYVCLYLFSTPNLRGRSVDRHQTLPHVGRYAVIGCKLKQNANEGCNSYATVVQVLYVLLQLLVVAAIILSFKSCCKFYCMFYFTCDRSFSKLWSTHGEK